MLLYSVQFQKYLIKKTPQIYADSESAVNDLTQSASDRRRRRSTTLMYNYDSVMFDGVHNRTSFRVKRDDPESGGFLCPDVMSG